MGLKRKPSYSCPSVLSVFSGAGGLDLGLESAGFKILACVDADESARSTLEMNRKCRLLEPADINELVGSLSPSDLGLRKRELSVIAGGPPCQPFSKAAQWSKNGMRGIKDRRAKCLYSFFSLVEDFLPTVVLLENVPGFTRGSTSVLPFVRRTLSKINKKCGSKYAADVCELNAADFGVPQYRKRTFIIARRDGESFAWPEPTHAGRFVRSYDALRNLKPRVKPAARGKWADLLCSIPEGKNYLWHTPEGEGRPLFGNRTRFWSFLLKLAKDQPAWTLSAQPGPATGPFHWENRPLAVSELLRLQSFPASWRVAGDYRAQLRQIGNSTPPLLAEVLARAIGTQVFGVRYSQLPRLRIPRAISVPAAESVRAVPQKFRELEGEHSPHPGTGKGPKPRAIT